MSRRILKYELNAPGGTHVDVGPFAEVLSVAFQDETLYVWVATPVGGRPVQRLVFEAFETGQYAPPLLDTPSEMRHVGTAHGTWRGQDYVAHVFMRKEALP